MIKGISLGENFYLLLFQVCIRTSVVFFPLFFPLLDESVKETI
jgi:hypothetical protein